MQQPTSCTTWALKATSFLFARSFHWSHQAPVTSAITSVPLSDQHRPYSGFESCDEAVVGLGKCCGLKVFPCGPSSCLSSSRPSVLTLQKAFLLCFNPSLFILCETLHFIIYYLLFTISYYILFIYYILFTICFLNLNAIQLEGIRNPSSCPHAAAQCISKQP